MWGRHIAFGRAPAARLRRGLTLAVAGAGLCLGAPTAAQAANPVGVHSMLYLDSPPAFMDAMFSEAAAMHASALRLDVAPALIFPSAGGTPDWSGLDEVMALAQRYRLRVLADLLTVPPWMAAAGCPGSDDATRSRCPPRDFTEYGQMIGQIVTHADPAITDWEVWNEPDRGQFFGGTAADYAQMLRAAHTAIKTVDPAANVVIGGITGTSGLPWLGQVFDALGPGAAQQFDTANLHERGGLDTLTGDVSTVRAFYAAHGFTGPLWVTEHGYPADPAFQWDPSLASGAGAQAAYLQASVPSLVSAGASEVFITERDNLTGPDASQGLLTGDVADPAPADPALVERPAYTAMAQLAGCYAQTGRDCAGPAPAAAPATLTLPAAALGAATDAQVTVSDPGPEPLSLAAPALAAAPGSGLSLGADGCPALLEPDQTCTVDVHFAPAQTGPTFASLTVGSDQGTLTVPVGAAASSVSALSSAQLPQPAFRPSPEGDGPKAPQSLLLTLTDAMGAPVRTASATLSGADAARFRLVANACHALTLAAGQSCTLAVVAVPLRPGTLHAKLTVSGEGLPLSVPLVVTAQRPRAVRLLAAARAATPGRRRRPRPVAG